MKLLHEDSNSYHLIDPKGRKLVISKSKLSDAAHKQVKQLPHFDQGGEYNTDRPYTPPTQGGSSEAYKHQEYQEPTYVKDPNPPAASPDVQKSFQNAFKKMAQGGDVMGHQTSHKPNPKTAQVPKKDRYANNILKEHYDGGGTVPIDQGAATSIQDSFRKATHYKDGGETKDIPVNASKLESMYTDENAVANGDKQPSSSIDPGQADADEIGKEFPNIDPNAVPDNSHAHLAEAVKNLSQKFVTPAQEAAPEQTQPSSQIPQQPIAGAQAPVPPQAGGDLMQQAQAAGNLENKSLANIGAANQQESASNVKSLDQQQQQLQNIGQDMEKYGQQYHENWDKIANNTNPEIDPNHYWNSKSTGGKIASAIGFLLGGAGLGASGHPELAGKVIQDAIDNDVNAQKATFQNKDNLLRQYTDAYHSSILGEDALRLHYGAQTENLIKRAAAQAGTQSATDQANLAIAKNRQALVGNMSNLAQGQANIDMMKRRQQLLSGSGNPNQDPSSMVPALVPEAQQKEVFSEIKKAQDATAVEGTILNKFDQASKENTVMRTGAGLARTPASVMELNALSLPLIHDAEGRVNEYEAKTLKDLMPAPGDTSAKINQKRQGFIDFINQKKAAPTAKGYGIDLTQYKTTGGHPSNEVQPVERQTQDGKTALFNPQTKQFLGYK